MLNIFTLANGRLVQEEIESLEPPVDLSEAVEGLVRATLLLADLSRPVQAPRGPTAKGPVRRR